MAFPKRIVLKTTYKTNQKILMQIVWIYSNIQSSTLTLADSAQAVIFNLPTALHKGLSLKFLESHGLK